MTELFVLKLKVLLGGVFVSLTYKNPCSIKLIAEKRTNPQHNSNHGLKGFNLVPTHWYTANTTRNQSFKPRTIKSSAVNVTHSLWLASRLVVFFENPWHDFIKVQLINRYRHRHRLPMKRKETNRNETRAKVRASSTTQQQRQHSVPVSYDVDGLLMLLMPATIFIAYTKGRFAYGLQLRYELMTDNTKQLKVVVKTVKSQSVHKYNCMRLYIATFSS
uniref:Uncharacterized protein n=1 Tax=Glossina pallidipes TaxID=7398 RepID=A0A1B0ADT9_GLOPL